MLLMIMCHFWIWLLGGLLPLYVSEQAKITNESYLIIYKLYLIYWLKQASISKYFCSSFQFPVLCFLVCLSSSFVLCTVLCIVVSITYYVVSLLCLSSFCVLCIVVSITYYVVSLLCLSSSCVLCIVVSITYYVVSLLCLSSFWYNTKTNKQIHNKICVRYHHTQDITRRQTNKYTTQYVLDTTIHKIQQKDKQTNIQHNMC
jgi:hypothetical protein